MHGIDFGGYTHWQRPEQSPQPIDFVIAGVAWGKNKNTTYDYNLPALRNEKRLMTYGFYNGTHDWKQQAETWLKLSKDAGSKFIWLDWERSSTSVLSDNPQRHAQRVSSIVGLISDEFGGKVGVYSNFNDYVVFLQNNWRGVRDIPWWVAWPDESFNSPPGNDWWWNRIDRDRNDYIIDQYSWKGGAAHGEAPEDWGITNNKKSMDLDVVNPDIDLDVWLGIKEEEEPPFVGDYEDGFNDCLALWRKEHEHEGQIIEGAMK
jgi:hypothetical protein